MEPTAYDHRQTNHLADDRATAAVRERLLHVRSDIFLLVAFHEDDPTRMQSSLSERREEQIGPRQAPDDRPLRACGDPRGKQSGRRAIDGSGTTSRELMKCAMSQAPARKDPINRFDTERKTARLLCALSLNRRDAFAQISQD